MYYTLRCETTTQIKLLTLAHCSHRHRSDWNSGGTHGGTYYKSPAVEAKKTHFPTL